MTSRNYLRAGEVPTLYGENSRQSDYQLWNELISGEERDMSEGGIWKGRLASEIMKGICEDHALKSQVALNPRDAAASTGVMPSKAWGIAPNQRTDGKEAVLIVDIRASTTMREWHAPDKLPAKALRRYKAVAYAYGVEKVVVGVLVDGYSSQLFVVSLTSSERAEMKSKVDAFLRLVAEREEPDLDFDRDSREIRSGAAVQKIAASAGQVDALSVERVDLVKRLVPLKAQVGQHEARVTQIDTMFIAMAGTKEKLETPSHVVDIARDAKGAAKITVVKKGQSLF
ncbi:hypothetical protein [Sphingomonas sp. 3-13AW]|uniref:hypothetical protein n=1 Tax=Sphingomonas sp. 3-13AW TaxID=3050450 RepID=UPI003BB74E7A